MKIPDYFKQYIKITKDPGVIAELQELSREYIQKLSKERSASLTLLQRYLEKARKIVRHSVIDNNAFEELVWKQNDQLRQLQSDEEKK